MGRFFIIFFLSTFPFWASAQVINFSSKSPLQGDAVVVSVFGKIPIEADFSGAMSSVFKYDNHYRIVFGIAPDKKPGKYFVNIKFADGTAWQEAINVSRRKFAVVNLGIPKELGITPKILAQELVSIKKNLAPVLEAVDKNIFFDKPFGLPLADNRNLSSYFGEIRKTGTESIRHLGIDFDASLGKYVYTVNNGVVSRAYEDKIYGKSVIVDHGAGFFSLYLHLDKILVRQGQRLFRGDILGTVGKTGYATSPHLHFSVKIRGVSVDPVRFVNAFGGL